MTLDGTKEHIDDLIAAYLAGEALPEEAMALEEWKHDSPDNLRYFDECKAAFRLFADEPGERPVHVDELYKRTLSQLDVKPAGRIISLTPARLLQVAAAVLFIAFAGITAAYLLNRANPQSEVAFVSQDSTQQQLLADGSEVFLNKHTRLTLASSFNQKERKLKLEGEAFFEVKHNADKPFVIDAGGVEIKDIGTAFNVRALPHSDTVSIFVTAGTVDVTNGNITIRLHEQQAAIYTRSLNILQEIRTINHNPAAYKTRVFHFRAAELGDVIDALNEVYGDVIMLENSKLASCLITVDLDNEPIETIVSVISETLELTYERTGSGFLLKGAVCAQ